MTKITVTQSGTYLLLAKSVLVPSRDLRINGHAAKLTVGAAWTLEFEAGETIEIDPAKLSSFSLLATS
jgi:hypothetical protein